MPTTTPPFRQTVFTTGQLATSGVTRARLTRLVEDGRLLRVRRGYYAEPLSSPARLRAVRIGGRLTATSSLREHRVWARPDDRLHVQVPHSIGRPRDPETGKPFRSRHDVVLHWSRDWVARGAPGDPSVESLLGTLQGVAEAWPVHHAVAAVDSALHKHLVSPAELTATFTGSSRALRCLARCDGRAEAGTESIARVRLADAGIAADIQVWITSKIRVDLLIGGWLVIEIDSREVHGTADDSSRDYRRDAQLIRLGHGVLHFDYSQVMFDWDDVLQTTRRALFAGR